MTANLIIKPAITEKSMILAQAGQFTFYVNRSASKTVIAQEIEKLFKVNVVKVRLVNKSGKIKRTGKKRLSQKTPDLRKAIVTLTQGQSIDYFKLPDEKPTKAKKAAAKPTSAPQASKEPAKKAGGLLGKLRKITTIKQPDSK